MKAALLLVAGCLAVLAALPGSAAQASAILSGKNQVVVSAGCFLGFLFLGSTGGSCVLHKKAGGKRPVPRQTPPATSPRCSALCAVRPPTWPPRCPTSASALPACLPLPAPLLLPILQVPTPINTATAGAWEARREGDRMEWTLEVVEANQVTMAHIHLVSRQAAHPPPPLPPSLPFILLFHPSVSFCWHCRLHGGIGS